MAYDYDKLYSDTPDALGAPTPFVTEFFRALPSPPLRVLDIGCGQGRDALFIARLGHSVVGVDLSPSGIRDLVRAAQAEALNVEGIVADVTTFTPPGMFDMMLMDRTLHMLAAPDRARILERLPDHLSLPGQVLILDEPRHMDGYAATLSRHPLAGRPLRPARSILHIRFG